MRYAGIIKDDLTAAPGVCVSFYTQGCPHRCQGCHNPETWEFDGGKEFMPTVIDDIVEALNANGIKRTFCILVFFIFLHFWYIPCKHVNPVILR